MRGYYAVVHKDADSDYGVSFPDLPGCVSAGSTLDEAVLMAREALSLHLVGMIDDGISPVASRLAAIAGRPESQDAIAIVLIEEDHVLTPAAA